MLCKKGGEFKNLSWMRASLSNNIQKFNKNFLKITISIILTLSLFSFKIGNIKEKYNEYENNTINDNNIVINNKLKKTYLDSVVNIGLHELEIKNITVIIRDLTDDIKSTLPSDITYFALVKKYDNNYVIWIDDMNRTNSIKILSHELIHIQQYNNKRLIINNSNIYWEQKEYLNINYVNYYNRPWENEAFKKQSDLSTRITNKL